MCSTLCPDIFTVVTVVDNMQLLQVRGRDGEFGWKIGLD
jgi:hypothetical protein